MTITLSAIHIAIGATFLIWGAAACWPISKPTGGMFDFGGTIDALAHGVTAIIATLIVWLIFFALR